MIKPTIRWVALLLCLIVHVDVMAQPQQLSVSNGRGNVPLYLPSNYDGTQPLPLIVGLHGYTSSGAEFESYADFVGQIESQQFAYLVPTGTTDGGGNNFWSATDACCNFFNSGVDDSSYLRGLVDLVRTQFSIDDASIHFAGHSNGGFMSHRMAIDHADIVASIASLAGANYANAAAFNPSDVVHMLQVHGTSDATISYNGGNILGNTYPSAVQTSMNWATYNGLQTSSMPTGSFNLDFAVPGDETTSYVFDFNNSQGITVELWEMSGSSHSPSFGNGSANLFSPLVVDWLLSHRKSVSCDFDSNGACDLADVDALVAEIAATSNDLAFDLNSDGVVQTDDLVLWLQQAGILNIGAPYLAGDANLDGGVDVQDFNAWNANKFSFAAAWSAGDFNASGTVDVSDFGIWNSSKFSSSDPANIANSVPEPHSSFLVGWMLSCVIIVRRQKLL